MPAKKKKSTRKQSSNTIIADGRKYLLIDSYELQVVSTEIYKKGVVINFESPLFDEPLAILLPARDGIDFAKNLITAIVSTHGEDCGGCEDSELHGIEPQEEAN
jgi:hypothetical protein